MAKESADRRVATGTTWGKPLLAGLAALAVVVAMSLPTLWERFLRPLSAAERKLVGRWVFAHSRRADAFVFEADRTWRYERDRTPTREISCHIGPTEGRWRISGDRLVCDDPQWDNEIITFVTGDEVRLGEWPHRRVP